MLLPKFFRDLQKKIVVKRFRKALRRFYRNFAKRFL